MKYTKQNPPLTCIMTNSTCYKGTYALSDIKGIVVHSTGANNPNIKRYVQPSDNDPNYTQLMRIIGTNAYKNDWNHIEYQAGVNAFVGKLNSGEVAAVQTLPWNYRPWGCGGACNTGWIQFEICEDNLMDENYFQQVYKEACELTAYLCTLYNINPIAKVDFQGKKVPTILCHQDTYKLGLGSNHIDVLHWFPKFGKDMDTFRTDVLKLLNSNKEKISSTSSSQSPVVEKTSSTQTQAIQPMTQEMFNDFMNNWMNEQAKIEFDADWSRDARNWAESNKYIVGDEHGRKMYKKPMTREELVTVLYRIFKSKGLL